MADDIGICITQAGQSLSVDGGDFPWLNARVVALTGFEHVAALFEEKADWRRRCKRPRARSGQQPTS
jgi:hypothetical protein